MFFIIALVKILGKFFHDFRPVLKGLSQGNPHNFRMVW